VVRSQSPPNQYNDALAAAYGGGQVNDAEFATLDGLVLGTGGHLNDLRAARLTTAGHTGALNDQEGAFFAAAV
jgi:hypothetical protein